MATNFGFMPVLKGKRYFISYKSEDSERVGDIALKLNELGVPMRYDYGIEKGERWNQQISKAIRESEAFILFVTKAVFSSEDTWVRTEYNIARMYGKKKYVVWLDQINPYDNPDEVKDGVKDWFLELDALQGLRMEDKSAEQTAGSMIAELHLIKGCKPQPLVPREKPILISESDVSSEKAGNGAAGSSSRVRRAKMIAAVMAALILGFAGGALTAKTYWGGKTAAVSGSDYTSSTDPDDVSSGASDRISSVGVNTDTPLKNLKVGDEIKFGHYPQDLTSDDVFDSSQPLAWRVLAVTDDKKKALIVTQRLLEGCIPYNDGSDDLEWESCTLCRWLNKDFMNKAFSPSQQAKIAIGPDKSADDDNASQCRIFILSKEEAQDYFTNEENRIAPLTQYAIIKGVNPISLGAKFPNQYSKWWWLRTPSKKENSVMIVGTLGGISENGFEVRAVTDGGGCVRPACWVNLD